MDGSTLLGTVKIAIVTVNGIALEHATLSTTKLCADARAITANL
jgi:hypothetical protein